MTLVELLVVVAVLGVLLMMVTAAVLWASDRARQAATMADMRNLAAAITAYSVDHGAPPHASGSLLPIVDYLELYHFNAPVPPCDHWLNHYEYVSNGMSYSLISFGKDGLDGPDLTWEDRFAFERDIVLADGRFRYASGTFEDPGEATLDEPDKQNQGKHVGQGHGTGKPVGVPGGG